MTTGTVRCRQPPVPDKAGGNGGLQMKPDVKQYTTSVGGETITFETGKLAGQAGGAVTIQLGDTLIFVAATMSTQTREGINFFPLTVDYEERLYAGGRIPGSFFRREGRPSENAILTARLTDRTLRPLFPKDMRNDVQVIMYSLSADTENIIDILAINAASAAVMISNIPWGGPVGAVRIGRVDGDFVVNPTYSQLNKSDLDLRVAGTKEAIMTVECAASEVDEETITKALDFAHESLQPLIEVQLQMTAEIGKDKVKDYPSFAIDEDLKAKVSERASAPLENLYSQNLSKDERDENLNTLRDEIVTEMAGEDEELTSRVREAFESINKSIVRERILEQ